jgi:hypothetical protein
MEPTGEALDRQISLFIEMALNSGYTLNEVRARFLEWIEMRPPDHILLIEPDADYEKS